jgi:4-amino-4-deoxy-L-arabinose transferase-like glycosyltransferase
MHHPDTVSVLTPARTLQLRWAVFLTLLVNAASMLTPIINEGDSVLYAALAQHIAGTGNWGDLILDKLDWLDKPHFPFWMGALFFKVFGISAFSYILPAFLFHLLGGYYTYRIAGMFYGRDTGLVALLLYVSTYHLMYTSSAIKAEAFLTGSITAACYYWLRFDAKAKLKYLLLGAAFSAISVMTKGIFTLITISSGLVLMWLAQGQWQKLVSAKWWLAAALSLLLTAPEVLSLYLQFDTHPEKVVFGQTHVSGIKFFLWDSQFGRFFNSGPIKNQEGTPLYFVHVFLWAFLPWVAVFVAALWSGLRGYTTEVSRGRAQFMFLCGTFFVTFGLFSATAFQLDYYTVILFPFANILCAHYLARFVQRTEGKVSGGKVFWAGHVFVTLCTLALANALALYVANMVLLAIVGGGTLGLLVFAFAKRANLRFNATLFYPLAAVNLLYVFLEGMTLVAYLKYSVPYNVKLMLSAEPATPVVVYQLDPIVAWELGLYRTSAPSERLDDVARLPPVGQSYFLLVKTAQVAELTARLGSFKVVGQGDWVDHKTGTLPRQLNLAKGTEPLENFSVLKVGQR